MFPPCSNPQKPSSCNCPRRYSSTWRRSGRSLQSIAEFSSWGSRFEKSPPGTPGCRNSERKGCVPSPRTKMGKSAIYCGATYVVAKLFCFWAAFYMFSLVQVVLTTSPHSGQPLKYHIVNTNQSQNDILWDRASPPCILNCRPRKPVPPRWIQDLISRFSRLS